MILKTDDVANLKYAEVQSSIRHDLNKFFQRRVLTPTYFQETHVLHDNLIMDSLADQMLYLMGTIIDE